MRERKVNIFERIQRGEEISLYAEKAKEYSESYGNGVEYLSAYFACRYIHAIKFQSSLFFYSLSEIKKVSERESSQKAHA